MIEAVSEYSTSTNNDRDFGKLVAQILALRGWVKKARQQLSKFRSNDIDDANVNPIVELQVEKDEDSEKKKTIFEFSIDETSSKFYIWTCVVCVICIHPLVFTALSVFNAIHPFLRKTSALNFAFDLIYMIDLIIQTRLEFVENGVIVRNSSRLLQHRIKSTFFVFDVLCILPTESIDFFGESFFFTRINRLFKCYRLSDFGAITETRTSFPHTFRLLKLIFVCLVIFHWNGCLYFYISKVYNYRSAKLEDWIFSYDKIINPVFADCVTDRFNSPNFCATDPFRITQLKESTVQETVGRFMSTWENKTRTVIFANFVRQYALSFYWSALTLVTLGEQPSPCTTFQNAFEIFDTLLGLVIFAVIVGDVGNMVTAINLRKSDFENVLDGCKRFIVYRKVPNMLRKKTIEYFAYVWTHGGAQVDENEIAEFLPPRLFGEIAVEIHMSTLKKVKLFEDCDDRLLYDLILKLQPRIYSPMDYICKKNEVGTEMYMVKEGFVEVVSEDGSQVFVTLGTGVVFGELSILNIPGNKNKNLRTASVRSKGYSDLYVLDKEDLWEALKEYPAAKDSLIEKGKQILMKDNMLDENMLNEENDDIYEIGEEKIMKLDEETKKIQAELETTENLIRESQKLLKNRLFRIEMEMIENFHWLKREKNKTH